MQSQATVPGGAPRPGRVAFVPPRYGPAVVGGAEAVVAEAATGLAARGWQVEVLTSDAVDHMTWANALPPGTTHEGAVTVRRFPMRHDRGPAGRHAQDLIEAGRTPSVDEQVAWINFQFYMPELFRYLLEHGSRFDAVVFAPYLFWSTVVGMQAVPDRAVVMPCLHDEQYAHLDLFRPVLSEAASVWFLSEPEHDLAHRLGPVTRDHLVTGAGVHVPGSYDPEGFRRRYRIERPFVLFAGRREPGKGWPWLLDAYRVAVMEHGATLDLVTLGVGEVSVPPAIEDRVIDLGFVSAVERDNAFAAAAAYVQPSRMESFSRTVMEAWLAGTPVLAAAGSEVVEWHCRQSGGGLVFADAVDLAAALEAVASRPDEAAAMAERGRRYVLDAYTWDAVLDRMEGDLVGVAQRRPAGAPPWDCVATGGNGVVVAGVYPPAPGLAASATMEAARQVLSAGRPATVVAPRLGAADRTGPLVGLPASITLRSALRRAGASELTLCVSRGLPFAVDAPRWLQTLTAHRVGRAVGRARRATLVIADDPGVDARLLRPLVEAASSVVVPRHGGPAVARRLGVPEVLVQACGDWSAGTDLPDVSVQMARSLDGTGEAVANVARLLLGRHAGRVGRPARRALALARRAGGSLGRPWTRRPSPPRRTSPAAQRAPIDDVPAAGDVDSGPAIPHPPGGVGATQSE